MASHVELDQASTEMHTCPECGKQFPRNCDLNKHAKSHTRPFKCSVSNCKYFELGWPTAKELDRHVNDKHSLSPQTFPCQFRDCVYRSKRESNCKQHMEKTHGWTYVKSKTNGKRSANQQDPLLKVEPDESAMLMDSRQNPYPTPRAEPLPVFNTEPFDFVLFEDDEPSVLGDADEVFDGLSPDGNQYLPWNSPMTRLRMTENFLERFSETYNSSTKSEPCKDDDLIDPQLSDAMHIDVPLLPCANNGVRMYPPVMGLKPELALMTAKPVSGLAALPASSAYSGQLVSAKRKRDSGILEATSGTSDAIPIRHRRAISAASAQSKQLIRSQTKQFPKKEEESDEEDTKPARKKRRSGEQFSDNNMPDIFHFAHPTIYNRDKKEKYSPCHSDHKDISTLVRHLSRPAHRLRVTDKLVSSFEIEDDDYMHPRVGVCRRCWSTFDNQQRFEDHLNVDPPCEKVSKGKREKWNILHDAFTPLVGEDEDAGHGRRGGLALPENEEDEEDEPPHAISRPTSPTTVDLTIAPPDRDERRYVPMAEHRRVQQENMQLKNFLQELAQRVKQNQGQAGQGAAAEQMANLLMQPRMSLLPGRSYQIETAQPEPERYHHHDIPYDAACLVGHMDSQSTDVDRQGLMEDVKTLSRANSGLDSSESRSTLHHVPTEDVESVRDGVPAQPQEPPPASNPDSGYATHSKRPSYAQEELAAQIKVSGVMTGHGAGVTTTSQAGAMMSQQIRQVQRELDLYQANYAFLPQPNGLSYLAPPGHGEIKAPSPTNERSISDAMWGDMRDPFAGAGSSQAASQSVANMISYSGGPGGEGGPEYPYDLVDFENDLSLEH